MEVETDKLNFWKSIAPILSHNCLVTDGDRLVFAGTIFSDLLGITNEEMTGCLCDDYFCLDKGVSLSTAISKLQSAEENRLILPLRFVNNKATHLQTLMVAFQPYEILGSQFIVGVVSGFNNGLSTAQELVDSRLQLSAILGKFSNTIFRTNMDGEITLISENVKELMGYTREEVMGTQLSSYYWSPEDRERSVQEILKQNGNVAQLDTVMRHKDGSPVWLASNVHLIKNSNGEPIGVEGIGHDVTYQKKLEQKLETRALTDSLTQLPNRRALMDELNRHFVSAGTSKSSLSLIMIDIKGTKSVNEQFGYMYGDALLKQVAALLKVYTQFPQVLGRICGDEFLYILPGYTIKNAVQFIAPVIEAVKQDPLMVGNKKVSYSLAIGMTELRKNDKNEYALLDRANKATLVSRQGMANFEVM